MKVRIEFEENLNENEVIIKCSQIDNTIQKIQKAILEITTDTQKMSFIKEDKEYYLSLDEILFFETNDNFIYAHTANDTYRVKYRLYELEEVLPHNFLRISKSTILNLKQVYSINKSLTSLNIVQFYRSHKQVYVSRYYFKQLKDRLGERRSYEK